ncbi:hypothetical protein EYF80_060214 [Liparis tanakae]|uniref:Uncharacterized protein n=1 Tax=Liparis tanakae TaxID=230148 RepID=A0A4Z2ELG6_9TELE|nr:hypothetical protein EYF80_060214 [Liparis tanakae]
MDEVRGTWTRSGGHPRPQHDDELQGGVAFTRRNFLCSVTGEPSFRSIKLAPPPGPAPWPRPRTLFHYLHIIQSFCAVWLTLRHMSAHGLLLCACVCVCVWGGVRRLTLLIVFHAPI